MKQISIIFPNQLFQLSPLIKYCCDILMIEDSLFWGNDKYFQFKNHINKIIFLKASMYSYKEYLEKIGHNVILCYKSKKLCNPGLFTKVLKK